MKKTRRIILYAGFTAVLILSFHSYGHAEIYFWTDAHGQKHFSNIVPDNEIIDETLEELKSDDAFDPSMNAVPEEEVQASLEKRRMEEEERKKRLEEERIAEEKRQLEARRIAEEERLKDEVDTLKRRLWYEREISRSLRYKLRKKHHDHDKKVSDKRPRR